MAPRRRRSGSVVGLSGGRSGSAMEMAVRGVVLGQRRGGEREMKRGPMEKRHREQIWPSAIFNWKTQRRWRSGHGDPGVGRRRRAAKYF